MKFCLSILLLSIALLTTAQEKSGSKDDIELNDVIAQINKSLKEAQNELEGITLKEASVNLETTSSKTGGGGFKIFVKASRKWSKETTSSVTFNFGPPSKTGEKALRKDLLAIAIKDAAIQYKASIPVGSLVRNSFEVEISFSLKKNTETGVEFELFGVELEGGADFEKTVFHKMNLKFE